MAHDYHGISLIRRLLGVGADGMGCSIAGQQFRFPVLWHCGRGGLVPGSESLRQDGRKVASFTFENGKVGFFDFDELLRIKSGESLPDALAHYKEGDQLLINWRIMTDGGLTFYDERPMAERFTQPMMPLDKVVKYADKPENSHVKCMVRGGLDDVRFTPTHNPHCAGTPRLKCINPSGEEVHQGAFAPIDHKVMWIDHYFTKTAEEWIQVRLDTDYPLIANIDPPLTYERLKKEKRVRAATPPFNWLYDLLFVRSLAALTWCAGHMLVPAGAVVQKVFDRGLKLLRLT